MSLSISLFSSESVIVECDHCGVKSKRHEMVYNNNITSAAARIAEAAGIYGVIWEPAENGIKTAGQMVNPIRLAIMDMRDNKAHYEIIARGTASELDTTEGYGVNVDGAYITFAHYDLYVRFLAWLHDLLMACLENPDATIDVCR